MDDLEALLEAIFAPKSTVSLADLLGRGYLPKELPPPFNSKSYSLAMTNPSAPVVKGNEFTQKDNKWCHFTSFSLARPGAIRRRLAILHPVAYYRLAAEIVKQQDILFKLASPGVVSLSHPKVSPSGQRAITTFSGLGALPEARAKNRVGKRYVLRTDVANFYPSIYTHALDWAITGKAKAKRSFKRKINRLGKRIDELVTAAQAGQTRGLPIGPDTSLLLAHVVLSPIDKSLKKAGFGHGFRFMDDYELAFVDRAEADRALSALLSALSVYELELNSLKTRIEELPLEIDNAPILQIKAMPLRPKSGPQQADLISLFNSAFTLSKAYPDKPILQYTVGRLNNSVIEKKNATLVQDLVLQCATIEPGVWPKALPLLRRLHAEHVFSKDPITNVIEVTIKQQASLGHSSEVAWCLWAGLVFGLSLSKAAVKSVIRMEDDACILLLLHAEELGIASIDAAGKKRLKTLAVRAQLYGEHWLLAYESVAKGWVKPTGGNYLPKEPAFKFLQDKNVSFYDTSVLDEPVEPGATDETTLSGYGSFEEHLDYDDEVMDLIGDD